MKTLISLLALFMAASLSVHSHAAADALATPTANPAAVPTEDAIVNDVAVQQTLISADSEQRITLPPVDEATDYQKLKGELVAGVFGTITSVGSDTLASPMALWAEAFQREYPHIKFQIQATGSATAPQALTQGTANLGPMSRELTNEEVRRFVRKYGYPPTVLKVAVDAIAIFVERNNPIQQLTLEQVDAIFSETRLCASAQTLHVWNDLGIDKFGLNREIISFGRNSSSGTYDLFKQQALCGGDYKAKVNELSGSASIVRSVASSIGGIGYAASGARTSNVKAVAVGISDKQGLRRYIKATSENVTRGDYPFWRYLYLVVNKPPNKPMPLLERTFLSFVLSQQGQEMLKQNGYHPIDRSLNEQQLISLFN